MTLPSFPNLIMAALGGVLLGIIHFGGLHWTVSRLNKASRQPAFMLLASSFLRLFFLVALLFYLSGLNFFRLVVLLAGVMIGRMLVIWYTLRSPKPLKGGRG